VTDTAAEAETNTREWERAWLAAVCFASYCAAMADTTAVAETNTRVVNTSWERARLAACTVAAGDVRRGCGCVEATAVAETTFISMPSVSKSTPN